MSATYFNRTIEVFYCNANGNVQFDKEIKRTVKEGKYRGGRFMVRYQKLMRPVLKRDDTTFEMYINVEN